MEIPDLRCSSVAGDYAKVMPYADVLVTLSKQEHIELVWAANYWKMEHRRAAERALRIEAVYEERLRQAAQREGQLRAELEVAQAKIRDLRQCLFGRKSERRKGGNARQGQALVAPAPREGIGAVRWVTDARCSRTCPSAASWSSLTHPNVRTVAWR